MKVSNIKYNGNCETYQIHGGEAVSIDFSNNVSDNDIVKMGADPFKVYLTVTD